MRQRTLAKAAIGLIVVAGLGVLFVRSAVQVGAEPYTLPRASLLGWTVALDASPSTSGVLLALWPPDTLAPPLFKQVFARSGLSLSGPNPVAMPLVLKREFDRTLAPAMTPQALVELAQASQLASVPPTPVCMASRRVSQPGSTRDVFFVRFEHPAFAAFRRQLAERGHLVDGAARFDASGLAPVVIVAATDADFSSWLPLSGEPTADCLAPTVAQ